MFVNLTKRALSLTLLSTAFLGSACAQDFRKELFEITPYAGGIGYARNTAGPGTDLTTGPVFGFRVGENLWKYFGLEQNFGWNRNKLEFLTPVTTPVGAGSTLQSRIFRFSLDGLYHFTQTGSRVRPYVAAGVGGSRFGLSEDTVRAVGINLRPQGQFATSSMLFQFNYGGGVKVRLNDMFSLRGDVRGLTSANPTFGLSNLPNGGAYIPKGNRLQGVEVSGGVAFVFGPKDQNAPAAGSATKPRKISKDFSIVSITANPPAASVENQGVLVNSPITFKAEVRNPKKKKLKYRWMVDGQTVGGDSDTLVYTPTRPGPYKVELEVSEADKKNPQFAAQPAPVPVYAKAPPPPPVDHRLTVGAITVDPANASRGVAGAANNSLTGLNATNSIGAGSPVRLSAEARDTLGHTPTYNWLVNGNQAGTGNPFTYTPNQPGWYRVELRVTDVGPNPLTASATAPVTIYARDVRAPGATCSAANPTLISGQSSGLSVNATVPQGHTARIRWALSEGSVTDPAAAQTTFNSSTVNFPANPQVQTKSITATATVTDDYGTTASCNTTLRVSTDPQPVHYGDILFGAGGSRVDNAAKRVLIERLYPELAGAYQGYTLALIGHIDQSERFNRNLDRNRVRNTAAVLSAGRGSCTALESSRIKADWIGQADTEYKDASGLADTRGSSINRNDPRARNRRVELWLVPAGKAMPGAMKEAKTLDTKDLRPLGCPR